MDETNGNDNERRMPWPVRIALGWFVLLAVISCVPLVLAVVEWGCGVKGSSVWGIVHGLFFIALGAGFVLAVLRGNRGLLTIGYGLIGVLGSLFLNFLCHSVVGALGVGAATVIPLVMVYLPTANQWYAMMPRRKRAGFGFWMAVAAVLGLVLGGVPFDTERAFISAAENIRVVQARSLFCLLVANATCEESGAQWVDVTKCTNTLELVEKLRNCIALSEMEEVDVSDADRAARQFSIAVNLPDDVPDTFPLMISVNLDPAQLPREWDGKTDRNKRLDLLPIEGAEPLVFGKEDVVIVRKGGAGHIVKSKFLTLGTIFGNAPYKLGEDTYFLTPVGKRKAGCK